MSFKFFQSLGFLGQPTVSQFRSAYGLFSVYTSSGAFVNTISLAINSAQIITAVDDCIDGGYDAIAWNETGANLAMARDGITEVEIDAILDAIKSIYNQSKAQAVVRGRPDLAVGFVDIPGGFANKYNAPLQYEQDPSNVIYVKNFQAWTSWMDRLNKRKINGVFVTTPFSNSCDFVSSNVSGIYGTDSEDIDSWKIFARRTLQEMSSRVSVGIPLYAYFSSSYDVSSYWIGVPVSSNHITEAVALFKQYANGSILYGGSGASYKYGNFRWRPSGDNESVDLASWTAVSNGAFSLSISGVKFKIQNIDTSAAASMSDVASVLQSAIQSKISSEETFDGIYPFPLGTVTVTWNSVQKSFLFSMTTNGTSTPQPPYFHRNYQGSAFLLSSKNDWGANLDGTDLFVSRFLGNPTINNISAPANAQWVYLNTQSNREWEEFAEEQTWWTVYSEQSLLNQNIKDFKYFYWSDFSGQPSPKAFKDSYNLDFIQVGGGSPFTETETDSSVLEPLLLTGPLSVSDSAINSLITTYLDPSLGDNQCKQFAFDLEMYLPYFDNTLFGDTVIDNMLESYVAVYERFKQLLELRGISDVKIGWYLTPAFKSYFDPVFHYHYKGNSQSYTDDYDIWVNKFRRLNLRKSGSTYITKKFSDSVDFVTCEIYPLYGEDDKYTDAYFKENLIQTARYLSGDKPFYAFIECVFHPSTAWNSKPVSGDYMIRTLSWVKRIADGSILWTAYRPSYRGQRQRHFMTSSGGPPSIPLKTLSDWQSVTNGCFSYFTNGFNRYLTGVDFSSATSIGGSESTSVANKIEKAINDDLYYLNSFYPSSTDIPGLVISVPYLLGTVSFTYNSNTSNNEPTILTQVPCFEFSYTDPSLVCPPDFNSYTGREWGYCYSYASVETLPVGGTDIGVADWIGTYTYTDQEYDSNHYAASADFDANEFINGWAVGNKWWHVYTSMALSHKYSKERAYKSQETLLDWQGAPTSSEIQSTYNIEKVYTAYTADSSWSQFTDAFILSKLNACISQDSNIFVWNIEGDYVTLDVDSHTDTQIDNSLDNLRSIYSRTKTMLVTLGYSDIKVGFYGAPFGIDTYYGGLYWANPSLYPHLATNGNNLINNYARYNQRFLNGSYIKVPFIDYNDAWFPSCYPISQGNETFETDETNAIKGLIDKVIEYFGHSKPIYTLLTPYFVESSALNPNTGLAQGGRFAQKMYTQALDSECDGILMWANSHPSAVITNNKFVPDGTKTLVDWQGVTNGWFILSVDCYACKVKNLNFSAAASMSAVAQIIQNGINAFISTMHIDVDSYPDSFSSPPKAQRHIGDVTFTWDSINSRFILNSSKGSTKTPKGQTFPPDYDKGYSVIQPWATWNSGESLAGTDLGVDEWIGAHTYNLDFTSTFDTSTDEFFGGWAEGSDWWNSYKSFSLGSFGTNLSNRIVPFINIASITTTGEVPCTIHVDAAESFFNGIDPQDCIFEWDFGDNNPDSTIANRTYISDHRIDVDVDSNGNPYRGTSLSSKQRGINAAYTYWHDNNGTPFTVTLKVWHNGVPTTTISKKITITDPTINDYPINTTNQWTKVQIMPDNTDPSGTEYPDAFQNLEAAIAWMNASKSEGKVIFEFISGAVYGLVNFPIAAKITVNTPNVIFRGLNQTQAYIEANGSFSRPIPTSLVEIGPTAYNIHFQEITFGKTSESPNTSALIGCTIKTPETNSSVFKNITFTKCGFVSLHQAVLSKDFVGGVYFNQCQSQQTSIKTFDMIGHNVVMNACTHSKFFVTQVIGTYNQTDCVVNFGTNSGIAEKFSMNFCDFRYNGDLSTSSSAGSLYIKNARYVTVYGSILDLGSNYIDDCFVVRFDSNVVRPYGNDCGIIVKAPISDITFASNRFNIDLLEQIAGVFRFSGDSGVINDIKIVNNNVVVKGNLLYTKPIWDFRAPTGTALCDIEFVNNLNSENAGICMSKWISIDNVVGQFSSFSHNIWPMRLGQMDFAIVSGTTKTWSQWTSLAIESNSQQVDVLVDDMISMYRNKLLISTYPQIQRNSFFHNAVSKDFNDDPRDSSTYYGVGASRPLISFIPSTSAFAVTSSTVSRARVAESGWIPSAAKNIFVNVTDTATQTIDSNFQLVSKPVQKKISTSVNNFVDFAPQEANNANCRALRVKIDLNQNPIYKSASFGIIEVSGANRFRGSFTLQDGTVQQLIDIPVLSYSTVPDLVTAIQDYGDMTLNLSGFSVQGFGSLPTSNLVATSLTIGVNRWAVFYYDLTINYGNYINTEFSVVTKTDGYDITITYTNDGPSNQTDGDPRQRLGSVYVDGLLIGSKFAYVHNTVDSSSIEIDTNFSLYNGSGYSYPFDKFSPTANVIGGTYGIGVSVKYDQIANNKQVTEITSAVNNCVTNRWKWTSEIQSHDYNVVNSDCLQKDQTLQVTFCVRITRDPKKWVLTLEPYKTYFAQNFGPIRFMKDPRPIKLIIPAINGSGQGLSYQNNEDQNNQNPSRFGWAWISNKIRFNFASLGYERQLMWSPSGLYGNSNENNNPFFTVVPLRDTEDEFPHSSVGPHSDTCLSYDLNEDCVAGTFTINPQLLQETFYMIRDVAQEVPVFGFYQGYGSVVHKEWEPDYKDISRASLFMASGGDPIALDLAINEWDLINYYVKANFLGIDSYSAGLDSQNDASKFLTFIGTQYEGTRLLTEMATDDIACCHGSSFIASGLGFSTGAYTSSPHYIADYILPGHEHLAVVYMNDFATQFPAGTYNHWYIKNRMAAYARWGYAVAHVDLDSDDINSTNVYPINSSTYQAVDRRFAYDTKPASYGPLASPRNVKHFISDRKVSFKYADLNKQTISLSWEANTEIDFSHYIIYKASIVNGSVDLSRPYQIKSYLKTPFFNDNQVFPNKTYYYKIVAVDVDGNVSEPTSYQVTHTVVNPILNPPANVSATSQVVDGKVVIAWNEPSVILAAPVQKIPPKIIIQPDGDWSGPEFASPLFDLSNVYPLINQSISYSDSDARTMQERAATAAAMIIYLRNQWMTYRPNTPFRWAFCPQNFGLGWGSSTTKPFYHISDRLSNGNSSIWTVNGRVDTKARMRSYYESLVNTLRANGVTDPIYVDPRYEGGMNIAGANTDLRQQWHGWLTADSRASSITFDGINTYNQYISTLTDLDGNSIPASELYPYRYATDAVNVKRVHVLSSLTAMALDYSIWDCFVIPTKEVWPNVVCGNYGNYGATRQYLVNNSRFKESPVDHGSNFRLDVQVPINYGWYPSDENSQPTGYGYNTFNESVYRFGVNIAEIKDPNAVIRALDIGAAEYYCKGCEQANPNKPISFWMTFLDYPIIYDNIHERSNLKFPTGFRSSLVYDKDHVINMFRVYNKYNVSHVGFFVGQVSELPIEQKMNLYEKLYNILSDLQEAGYVVS